MKIYTFWSGDTTYFTKSKSLKKAQEIGQSNFKLYLDTYAYFEEEPTLAANYFIPEEVEEITIEYFRKLMTTDSDTLILDDNLRNLLK